MSAVPESIDAMTRERTQQMLRESESFESVRRAALAVLSRAEQELHDAFARRSDPVGSATDAVNRLRDYLLWREVETEMLEAAAQRIERIQRGLRAERRAGRPATR